MRASMACTDRAAVLTIAVSMSVLCAIVSPAAAQQPTKAQENALRSACSSDFRSYCSNVKPSGGAAMACLQRNAASLSAPCRKAVSAVGGGSAPAGAAPAARGRQGCGSAAEQSAGECTPFRLQQRFQIALLECQTRRPCGVGLPAAQCRVAVRAMSNGSERSRRRKSRRGRTGRVSRDRSRGLGSPGQTGTGSPGQTPGADVASVEWVSGRVIAFSLGKPALLLNSDIISDRTQLDLQADSELQICHYKANRF